jgi:hypothetical protein
MSSHSSRWRKPIWSAHSANKEDVGEDGISGGALAANSNRRCRSTRLAHDDFLLALLADAAGNALPEGTVVVDARGNLVKDLTTGSRKRFALVGVEDLVIVETDDAVLVIPRERAQDVRAVVEALQTRGETERL